MPGTFSTDLIPFYNGAGSTLPSDAESTTGWSGGTLSLNNDIRIQGTNSINKRVNNATVTTVFAPVAAVNLTGKLVASWIMNPITGATPNRATPALRIRVASGTGANWKEFYVEGADSYKFGAWKCYLVDPAATGNATGGAAYSITTTDRVGHTITTNQAVSGTVFYHDALRYGTYLRAVDGTDVAPVTWADFVSYDNTSSYGLCTTKEGVIVLQGSFEIGSTGQTADTRFADSNKTLIWQYDGHNGARFISGTQNNITIRGASSTNDTIVTWGTLSSGLTSGGLTIAGALDTLAPASPADGYYAFWTLSVNTNSALYAYACTLSEMDSCTLTATSDIQGTTIRHSGIITTNGCTFKNNTILRSTAAYAVLCSNFTNFSGNVFSNNINGHSIQIPTAGSYNFNALGFTGGGANNTTTADVNNSSAGTVDLVNINGTQHTYTLRNSASGTINVYDRVILTVNDGAGAAVSAARSYVYVNSLPAGETETMPTSNRSVDTSAGGVANQDVLKYNYAVSTLKTWDQFYFKVFKYAKQPFSGTIPVTGSEDLGVTLLDDSNITAANAATALTNGSGITITKHGTGETDTRPMKVMHYDGGTAAIAAGNTLVGATSGASGTVVEVIGTTTDGIVVIKNWNGTEYQNNENLQVSGATKAVADTTGGGSSFYQPYTWEINCNSLGLSVVYDWLSAKFEEDTADANIIKLMKWSSTSVNQQPFLYNKSSNSGATIRQGSEGVWLSNRGSGTMSSQRSDNGVDYVPPVQYTFTLTGIHTGSEVRIYKTSDSSELAGVESSGTSFSYNYIHTGDIGVYVVVFHTSYNPIFLEGLTLAAANQSIPIQQIFDRQYSTGSIP